MKNSKLVGTLILFLSCFIFIQCTSDPIMGPQGVAGADGINGIDGIDGTDAEASCIACHSESHRAPITESYEKSSHYNQTVMYNGSLLTEYTNQSFFNGSCAKCHSNEGYINHLEGKPASTPISNPTVVSCNTCHSKHSTFDFENDGHDYALRTIEPLALDTDPSYTIDYGNASNSCLVCHQPRSKAPVDDGTGLYLQANPRFYPHYGGQSTVLEGIQGSYIEVEGAIALPEIGSSAHRTGASCTSCHMGASTNAENGMHTFKVTLDSCTDCHGANPPTVVTGLAEDMAMLKTKLIDLGLLDEQGNTPVQTEKVPFKQVQALWNYETVYKDGSHGVHNPTYTKALIKNALLALEEDN